MTRTFHFESSQTDRIAWDEETANYARAIFKMDDYADDRVRRGELVAADLWHNTYVEIEQGVVAVDDLAEAEARYLDAFAKAWDAERAALEARDAYNDEDDAGWMVGEDMEG